MAMPYSGALAGIYYLCEIDWGKVEGAMNCTVTAVQYSTVQYSTVQISWERVSSVYSGDTTQRAGSTTTNETQ